MTWEKKFERREGISYCRKSTKPRNSTNEKESIHYQESEIERYCQYANIDLVSKFSDIGYSGKNLKRPELQEMLTFLQNTDKEIKVILFYTIDRLGRDLRSNMELIQEITGYVEEVIFVDTGSNSTNEEFLDRFVYSSAEAEDERSKLKKLLISGKKSKVNKGSFIGPSKPLGYIQTEKGKLEIANLENTTNVENIIYFEIVKFIFLAHLFGLSMNQIAKLITSNYGKTKRNKIWNRKSVNYILRNPIYAGILRGKFSNKDYTVNTDRVSPIISKEIYYLIKVKLETERPGRKPNNIFLPNLSLCIDCLYALEISTDGKLLYCPVCTKEFCFSDYINSYKDCINKYLIKEGLFKTDTLQKHLEKKKTNLLFRLTTLNKTILALKERRIEIERKYFYDSGLKEELLYKNESEIANNLEGYDKVATFLKFIFETDFFQDDSIIKYIEDDKDVIFTLPYLVLIDFNKSKFYLKFHQEVLENES